MARAWRRYGVKPWRRETFKFSTDPELEATVRDVIGLYLNLPEKATHDYQRNGTTALFAALEVATGKVTDRCYGRHGKAEFLDFLENVARAYPRRQLHVVCDNYHTHKHADITTWLDKNPCVTQHFTPTSGSWLNMVEVFFSITTARPSVAAPSTSSKSSRQLSPRSFKAGISAAAPSSGPRAPTKFGPTPVTNHQTRNTR